MQLKTVEDYVDEFSFRYSIQRVDRLIPTLDGDAEEAEDFIKNSITQDRADIRVVLTRELEGMRCDIPDCLCDYNAAIDHIIKVVYTLLPGDVSK